MSLAGAGVAVILAACAGPSPQPPELPMPAPVPAPLRAMTAPDDDSRGLDVFSLYRRAPALEYAPEPVAAAAAPAAPRLSQAYASLPPEVLFARALGLDEQGQYAQAVAFYRVASQSGHAPSSHRLMELYADGAPGVARDYRAAVHYKQLAVQQGDRFDATWRR